MAVLAAALLLISGSPAMAAEKAIWGPLTLPDGRSAFDTYRALGTDTFQMQIRWPRVAPTRPAHPADPADPAYRWPPEVDRALAEARRTGLSVALLVGRTPGWANGGRPDIWAPTAPADFARFVEAAARRYPAVRRWMIWGEPNRNDRFQPGAPGGSSAGRAYAPILDAAYGALKRVSPRNLVIGGMTWTGGDIKPKPFLDSMRMPGGRRPRLDWFGHNPFPFRFPDLRELALASGFRDISDLDLFTRELRRAYGRRVRLWLSEFTVLSGKRSEVFELFVSRRDQARWLAAGFRIADSLPSVAGLGWLDLLDQSEARLSSNWGLLTASGAPKPALRAYARAPSARFRARVRARRRIGGFALAGRGLAVRVRPPLGGRVAVELSRRGRRAARVVRRMRGGSSRLVRLRVRRPRRGVYMLAVRAPRGSTVRRTVVAR